MTYRSSDQSGLSLADEPVAPAATPFPRFEGVARRLASGPHAPDERESEIPRTDSAAELRLRMTRRTLRR